MESIQELVQNNGFVILLVVLAALPFCYIYRQYTYPFFFHVAEGVIYASVVHAVLSGLVRLAAWFKEASSFDRAAVNWTTPLFAPWDRSAYEPQWVFWLTISAWVLIAYIIIVIRPVGTKNKYRRAPETGKKAAAGTTPRGSAYTYKSGRTTQAGRRR